MDERQVKDSKMEELIKGIRESEQKSKTLSETLMQFGESFERLMAQIQDVGKLKDFETSHEKIISLEENIAGIKEDIELINTAQMVRLNELEREFNHKLEIDFKETLKKELKAEILQGIDHIVEKKFISYVEKSLIIDNKKYSIDTSRKLIHLNLLNKGNELAEKNRMDSNGESTIIYESPMIIQGILKGYDEKGQGRLLVYLENGEVHMI